MNCNIIINIIRQTPAIIEAVSLLFLAKWENDADVKDDGGFLQYFKDQWLSDLTAKW